MVPGASRCPDSCPDERHTTARGAARGRLEALGGEMAVRAQRCSVTIESRTGGGHAAPLPFDPKAVFGQARPPVKVTVAGHEPFPTRIMIYGGVAWIGFRKAQLAELDLHVGETVDLVVELDEEPRPDDLPSELAETLAADPAARSAYDALSATHRKEYARWVGEAKQAATRATRAAKAIRMLNEGARTPR